MRASEAATPFEFRHVTITLTNLPKNADELRFARLAACRTPANWSMATWQAAFHSAPIHRISLIVAVCRGVVIFRVADCRCLIVAVVAPFQEEQKVAVVLWSVDSGVLVPFAANTVKSITTTTSKVTGRFRLGFPAVELITQITKVFSLTRSDGIE